MGTFVLTEEQRDLLRIAADFGERAMRPVEQEYDDKGETPLDVYQQAVEVGFVRALLPEDAGGFGFDCVTKCLLTEELSFWEAGIANTISANGLAARPVLLAGTPAQKRRVTDSLLAGSMGAFALTEPNAGSDAAAITTTAVRDGEDYVLNGRKCFITNAPYADFFIVFAKTDRTNGVKGISAFLVERSRQGVSTGRHEDKMGLRLAAVSDVLLENVRVPAENLIGVEGGGFKLAMQTLDSSRIEVAAAAVGIARHAVELAVGYAKERIAFGKPIARLQAVQFLLADMQIQTQAARSLTYHAAELHDAGQPYGALAAAAKCMAGDTAMQVTTDAVQILSGYGYMRDYPAEKLMRDAKVFQIFEGTNQIQRVVVASAMLR